MEEMQYSNNNEEPAVLPHKSVVVNGKELVESRDLEAVAKKVIEEENFDLRPATIGYLLIYPNLSKTTVAKCKKASREEKYYSDNDYIIEVSGEAWDMLDDKSKYMLVYHELMHVFPVFNEKKEEWKFKTRNHDFADFYEINDRHGSDWFKIIQGTVSSLYDMDPTKEGDITL